MEKIKLLFCHDRMVIGGTEKAFCEIADGLLKTGKYSISVWCKTPITEKYFLDFFEKHSITLHQHLHDEAKHETLSKNIRRFFRRFINRYANDRLFRRCVDGADVIVDFKNGCMQSRLRKVKDRPKIVWLQCSSGVIIHDIKTDCSVYDKVVCISHCLRHDMQRYCPKLKDRLETIYLPFDLEHIRRLAEEEDHFSDHQLALLGDDYFLVVTRLSRDKDSDTVILAYEMFLRETSSKTKLYFIGDGSDRLRLEQMAADCRLSEMILFLGQISEPYAFVKHSKASILSSKNEGAPLVIVEGMALKTIVVASDCPTAPRELLSDGRCGVLFTPGNAAELRDILAKIDRREITKEQFSDDIDAWIKNFEKAPILKQIQNTIDLLAANHTRNPDA
ncbi:MAG: glycosyltransferase [Holosporaceae bacterium]|jgi:glycosyltransferase involved in cell wall biosynthesis|nr:glycosyltransferase [Holosporaceae bacterium]